MLTAIESCAGSPDDKSSVTTEDPLSSATTLSPTPPTSLTDRSSVASSRRDALRTSTIEGGLSTVHITLTGGHFITGYALMLGASDFQLGLMNSLVQIVQVFQLIAAWVTNRVGSRKLVCSTGVVIYRGMFVLFGLLPFLTMLGGTGRIWVFLALLLAANVALMFTSNSWTVWMGDLVPERIRGRYFGSRSSVAVIVSIFTACAGAVVLDYFKSRGLDSYGFLALFSVGTLFAAAGVWMLARQWEPPMKIEAAPTPTQLLKTSFSELNFRQLCIFSFVFNCSVGISCSFFSKLMIKYLEMSYGTMYLHASAVAVVTFICSRPAGRLIDRLGTKPVAMVSAVFLCVTPLIWLFIQPGRLWLLGIEAATSGALWTAYNLAAFNLTLAMAPKQHRSYYIGVLTTVGGLGLGASCLLSGELATLLSGFAVVVPWMDAPLLNYHVMILVSILFRMISLYPLSGLQDERGYDLLYVSRSLRQMLEAGLTTRLESLTTLRHRIRETLSFADE